MITNTIYKNKEKSPVQGTAINAVIYLKTTAWQVLLNNSCVCQGRHLDTYTGMDS